jgi:hypothetical protein
MPVPVNIRRSELKNLKNMNDQDEFAILFGDWLSENCETVDKKGTWIYYSEDGANKRVKTTELLQIFKDENSKIKASK